MVTPVCMETLLTFKFGLLKHLDLANKDIVQRVDGLAGLLNVLANTVRDPGSQQHRLIQIHKKKNVSREKNTKPV